jgi:hypothetical protein
MSKLISGVVAAVAIALIPSPTFACACGCGIFDIGPQSLMPLDSQSGLTVWFRYDEMNQNKNWEGNSQAPAADNGDKRIKTDFYTFGAEYMINRKWTVMAELPIFNRSLKTTDDGTVFGPAGSVNTRHITALGDLKLSALYTGLSDDMSTGIGGGVKLPTGDYTGPSGPLGGAEFDRDSLPGTGSTDLMVMGYHVGKLSRNGALSYFLQAQYQFAVATRDGYRPGNELDAAAGVTYDLGIGGPHIKVAPVLQLIESYREHDTGVNADPLNSGYERLLIAPGIDVRLNKIRLYADVEIPIHQHTRAASSVAIEGTAGQLVASPIYKLQVSYSF